MRMKNIRPLQKAALLLMALFSLSGFIPTPTVQWSSITLAVGIVVFFITWKEEKAGGHGDGMDVKRIPQALKDKNVLLLMLMPALMNIVCYAAAFFWLPDFIVHLKERTGFLSLNAVPLLLVELAVAALGEEIAWRAFFQKQLAKAVPFVPALLVSSALFALCHLTQGTLAVVVYDLAFVCVNAIFYGLVFRKTDNAYVSALAHFFANLLGIVGMMLL